MEFIDKVGLSSKQIHEIAKLTAKKQTVKM
jgi:hypothetical protein